MNDTEKSPRPRRRGPARLLTVLAVVAALVAGFFVYRMVVGAPAGRPQATELGQARISDRIASATVLGVGEATHGTREFRSTLLWAVQQLADRGFTTIAFEESAGHVSEANDWLQGGEGTAEQAAGRFGFRLNRTRETAELLTWIRAHNEGRAPAERIQLYGIDVQRPEADRRVALAWLAQVDPARADAFRGRLEPLTDASHRDPAASAPLVPLAAEFRAAVEAAAAGRTDDAATRALASARALAMGAELGAAGKGGEQRDRMMADQLGWLVERRQAAGGVHSLLFGHNGHVDKRGTSNAAQSVTLGTLAGERWGEGYKAIGTDAHHVRLLDNGSEFSFTVDSPVRGLFGGTALGYLEFAAVEGPDAEVLTRTLPMASAGSPFQAVQAWVPWFHEASYRPAESFDALVYAETTTPVTPLG